MFEFQSNFWESKSTEMNNIVSDGFIDLISWVEGRTHSKDEAEYNNFMIKGIEAYMEGNNPILKMKTCATRMLLKLYIKNPQRLPSS